MGRNKGGNNRVWSKEQKYEIIKPIIDCKASIAERARDYNISNGMISNWLKKYRTNGIAGLENKRKTGNPLVKFQRSKKLSELELLEYENLMLKIENERLKKGYIVKGDGTVLMSKNLKKKNNVYKK